MKGQLKIKEDGIDITARTFRSKSCSPKANDDMATISFSGPVKSLRSLLIMMEQLSSIAPEFVDPNSNLLYRKWYRLKTSSVKVTKAAMRGEWAFEEWVNGTPGTNPNYIKVVRFVEFAGGENIEHAQIILHGNAVSTEKLQEEIRLSFLGKLGNPNYVYCVDEE